MSDRIAPPYEKLDPGIRETVRWLFEQGFEPCDSGDGRSKFDGTVEDAHDPNMFLRFPNIAMLCDPDRLVQEADRLMCILAARGIDVPAQGPDPDGISIQASYDPADPRHAVIILCGVDDALLRGTP